ncbi:hypothetical protein C4561_02195 [candidate division WWE3 bacterium]|uniref:Uncharacterized protein n=1 Tax=candidate division WWE3 bacterium TaxID=2053526 RepID=A0A3A4ZE32_UNCKA|nr:MAG: hypothetical protein C4561_02195 [candidate division WWE3 bacterium]
MAEGKILEAEIEIQEEDEITARYSIISLMVRICPTCNNKLGIYDYFFCSVCGTALPSELVNSGYSFVKTINFIPEKKKGLEFLHNLKPVLLRVSHILNLKLVLAVLLVMIAVGFPIYVLIDKYQFGRGLSLKRDTEVTQNVQEPNAGKNALKLSLSLKSHVFGTDKISEWIPYDADFYVEGQDLNSLADKFVVVKPHYLELAEYVKDNFSQHFAFFGMRVEDEMYWSVVLFPVNPEGGVNIDLSNYEWLETLKIDDAILIANHPLLLAKSEEAKSRVSRNLQMNPKYILSKNAAPKSGQLYILALTNEGKEESKNKETEFGSSEDLFKIIQSFNQSGLEDVVIY